MHETLSSFQKTIVITLISWFCLYEVGCYSYSTVGKEGLEKITEGTRVDWVVLNDGRVYLCPEDSLGYGTKLKSGVMVPVRTDSTITIPFQDIKSLHARESDAAGTLLMVVGGVAALFGVGCFIFIAAWSSTRM